MRFNFPYILNFQWKKLTFHSLSLNELDLERCISGAIGIELNSEDIQEGVDVLKPLFGTTDKISSSKVTTMRPITITKSATITDQVEERESITTTTPMIR